jgi:hypothetical protein
MVRGADQAPPCTLSRCNVETKPCRRRFSVRIRPAHTRRSGATRSRHSCSWYCLQPYSGSQRCASAAGGQGGVRLVKGMGNPTSGGRVNLAEWWRACSRSCSSLYSSGFQRRRGARARSIRSPAPWTRRLGHRSIRVVSRTSTSSLGRSRLVLSIGTQRLSMAAQSVSTRSGGSRRGSGQSVGPQSWRTPPLPLAS